MQDLKTEAETIETNDCTRRAQAILVGHMGAVIDILGQFRRETGDANEAMQERIKGVMANLVEFNDQLEQCKPQG
jgi:hypothetical protein